MVFVLVCCGSVKISQSIIIDAVMSRNPVNNHADVLPVAFIDEALKLLRLPVSLTKREIPDQLVSP